MNRGQIVEVDWPYSDLSGTKVRPAIVVEADYQSDPARRPLLHSQKSESTFWRSS